MILTGINYITDATLTSTDGYNSLQNIEYLKIPQLSKNFVMNTSGVIVLSGVATIPCLIIDKGNCTSITATVTYLDAYVESYDLTATDTCFYHFLDKNTGAHKETGINTISMLFIGPLSGTDLLPSVGYIHAGEYLQLPAISPSAVLYYDTTSQKTSSISGQQYSDRGYQTVSTTFEFPRIPESTESYLGKIVAGRKQILATWRETEFQYSWLFPWEQSLADVPPIFGSMNSTSLEFIRSGDSNLYWTMSFDFKEVK